MDMTFTEIDTIKESIEEDVLYILDSIRKDRSFLNKHFQNSITNYFLEDYAGLFLKSCLRLPKAKQITKYIQNKYEYLPGTKYMKLMYGYFQELKYFEKIEAFKLQLIENISQAINEIKPSKEWQSAVWKRAFSFFVLQICQEEGKQQKGIFEIWNSLFPLKKIYRKRQENVNHREKEYTPLEINCVRSQSKKNQLDLKEQQSAFEQVNVILFGGDCKDNQYIQKFPQEAYSLQKESNNQERIFDQQIISPSFIPSPNSIDPYGNHSINFQIQQFKNENFDQEVENGQMQPNHQIEVEQMPTNTLNIYSENDTNYYGEQFGDQESLYLQPSNFLIEGELFEKEVQNLPITPPRQRDPRMFFSNQSVNYEFLEQLKAQEEGTESISIEQKVNQNRQIASSPKYFEKPNVHFQFFCYSQQQPMFIWNN